MTAFETLPGPPNQPGGTSPPGPPGPPVEADESSDHHRSEGRVVVVGSLNEDVLILLQAPLEHGGTVLAGEVSTAAGGKGLNQAVAAARAGATTTIIGCIGDDDAGQRLLEAADRAGVGTGGVVVAPSTATGRAYVLVDPDGASTIAVDAGANAGLTPAALDHLGGTDVLLVQLEVPLDTARAALLRGHNLGVLTILSASPVVPGAAGLVALADVVVCNLQEARALTAHLGLTDHRGSTDREGSTDEPARGGEAALAPRDEEEPHLGEAPGLARSLVRLGTRASLVTLGAKGAILVTGGRSLPVAPVHASEVRDTTGAGDAATGAFGAALARGEDLATAASLAMRAGSEATAGLGAHGEPYLAGPFPGRRPGPTT